MGFRSKLRAFICFWVTPQKPIDPNVRFRGKVVYTLLVSLGGALVVWWYFYREVSYDAIPAKSLFWLSWLAWALPPIAVELAYRKSSSKRYLNAYANMAIIMGIVGIAIGSTGGRFPILTPIAYAGVPGVMTGALIGSDSVAIWIRLRPPHGNVKLE